MTFIPSLKSTNLQKTKGKKAKIKNTGNLGHVIPSSLTKIFADILNEELLFCRWEFALAQPNLTPTAHLQPLSAFVRLGYLPCVAPNLPLSSISPTTLLPFVLTPALVSCGHCSTTGLWIPEDLFTLPM